MVFLFQQVEIEVSACDRVGNFIGWLFIDDVNLSLSLVKVAMLLLNILGFLQSVRVDQGPIASKAFSLNGG